jgi:trk system potassium uptake protein TrkA
VVHADRAGRVPEVGLGAGGEQPAQDLVGGPLHGGHRGDAQPLVHLGPAGIEKADAFAAVSSGDNSNIIAARVARETFNVQKVIARIYDAKRAEVYERLGIPTIATVPWTANRLLKAVLGDSTDEVWREPSGVVALVRVAPDEGWIGHLVRDFETATGGRVAVVTRFGAGELPTASTMVQDGDVLHVLVDDAHAQTLRDVAARAPEGAH